MAERLTMGDYLRASRTEQSISLERAAQDTKIKADFLMRMESDEFDFIAPAYARGFLRSYARYLGLDDEPFLDEFDRRFGTGPVDTVQMVAADRRKQQKIKDHSPFSRWTIVLVIAAGVLLTLALIGIFAPQPNRDRGQQAAATSPSPSPAEDRPKEKRSPSPTSSPTLTPEEVFFADGIELTVEATQGDCWVDVDADGQDVFAETMTFGSSQTFTAEEDMSVVLGAPGSVELILNGEALGSPPTDEAGALTFTLPDDFGTTNFPIPEGFDPTDPSPLPSPSPTVSPTETTE
ncbi:MAG: DUF4115 domain-containing protein [Actinomycetota bacterium]|nr:DUF4115 domain-containing protein [Actinomycetota bacterium]